MIEGLLKNGPTNDMDEIKEAVEELLDAVIDGERAPETPVLQINQAALSDLRCYYDMDSLVQGGWLKVGDVMSAEEMETLFDEYEIPDKEPCTKTTRFVCPECGKERPWSKYNNPKLPHYVCACNAKLYCVTGADGNCCVTIQQGNDCDV